MIVEFNKIIELFREVNDNLSNKINIYVIGGAVLLEQGLKSATKDIDIVVSSQDEFYEVISVFEKIKFESKKPGLEYKNMNLSGILVRDDFRIDLFYERVCGRFSLSEKMIEKSRTVLELSNLSLNLCSNEDIFLFKTMTEREGDLEDCISLAKEGLDWNKILEEIKLQIKTSGRDVWITWIGERLDILVEKGLNIPIMSNIDKLREEFFESLEGLE